MVGADILVFLILVVGRWGEEYSDLHQCYINCSFFKDVFIRSKLFPCICSLLRDFIVNGCCIFFKSFYCTCLSNHRIFFFYSVDTVYHINRFFNVEPTLNPGIKQSGHHVLDLYTFGLDLLNG